MVRRLGHLQTPVIDHVRLTIPAREAILYERGNRITPTGDTWRVELARPPTGLVVVGIIGSSDTAVRLAIEPPWPGECDTSWDARGLWVPCPECGMSMLWGEAGYVPGWRICLCGHAVQLSSDGRRGVRHPDADVSTVRATHPIS